MQVYLHILGCTDRRTTEDHGQRCTGHWRHSCVTHHSCHRLLRWATTYKQQNTITSGVVTKGRRQILGFCRKITFVGKLSSIWGRKTLKFYAPKISSVRNLTCLWKDCKFLLRLLFDAAANSDYDLYSNNDKLIHTHSPYSEDKK